MGCQKCMSNLSKVFIAFAVLYLVWHLGRYYENVRLVDCVYLTEFEVSDPVPNAVSDLFISGNWKVGLCR